MTLGGPFGPAVDRSIRAGAPPTAEVIARMVAEHTATLGDRGPRRRRDRARPAARRSGAAHRRRRRPHGDRCARQRRRVRVGRPRARRRAAGMRVPAPDLRALAVRLAGVAGRRLDDAQPWVDGVLPGGARLHAVLPPLAEGGPHLSLRFARHRPQGVGALEALGAVAGTPPRCSARSSPTGSRSSSPAARAPGRRRCWPRSSPSARRTSASSSSRTSESSTRPPARRPPAGPLTERRGTRWGDARRPRPPGPADAARPARRR